MTNDELAVSFEAIANPLRISILKYLVGQVQPVSVSTIASMTNSKDATVSHHLQKLFQVQLVGRVPSGRFMMYAVNQAAMNLLVWEMTTSFMRNTETEIAQ